MQTPFRVLSLDGGGVRGLYTAVLLKGLAAHYAVQNQKSKLDVGKGFDLIAGTSTGGILATALAFGLPLEKIIDLYSKAGPQIFPDPMPVETGVKRWAFRNRNTPAGKAEELEKQLNKVFGDTTLETLYLERGIALCIPSISVSDQKSWAFKTPHCDDFTRDKSFTLTQVCLATSAAPFFFPMPQYGHPLTESIVTFVDGGLWANNPVLVGLIEALTITGGKRPIEIVSVGTCSPPVGELIDEKDANRGVADWKVGVKALELSLEAQAEGHSFMANLLRPFLCCDCEIVRLPSDPPSSEKSKYLRLDNAAPTAIAALKDLASHDVDKILGLIKAKQGNLTLVEDIFRHLPKLED